MSEFKEIWLPEEKGQDLFDALVAWMRPIILFGIHTGLPESEVIDLTRPKVNFLANQFVIIDQKNGDIATLPLDETALKILRCDAV